jgi:U3 small nucleolar RNA-associated protein 20
MMLSVLQAPVRYLLGALYVNFSPVWKPTVRVLATHAQHMPRDAFWDVFGASVESAAPLAGKSWGQFKIT